MGQAQFRATRQPRMRRRDLPVLVRLPAIRGAAMEPRIVNRGGNLSGARLARAQNNPQESETLHLRTPASERFLRLVPLVALVRVAGALCDARGKSPISCGKSASGMSAPLFTRWHARQ